LTLLIVYFFSFFFKFLCVKIFALYKYACVAIVSTALYVVIIINLTITATKTTEHSQSANLRQGENLKGVVFHEEHIVSWFDLKAYSKVLKLEQNNR